LLAALGLGACNKSDQQDAVEAERKADDKAEQAQLEANEKISEARREAEKASNDAARQRSEARVELQKDIDAVDRKISNLKDQAVNVQGGAKKNAEVARAETETRRSALQTSFRKLETETGAAWDSAKADVQRSISDLEASVESWENAMSKSASVKAPAAKTPAP